jgi:hypothetical protein
VACAAALLVAGGGGAPAGAATRAAYRAPVLTTVGVGLREWSLAVYRAKVPAGRVRLAARNFGEDPHDVAVRDARGRLLRVSAQVRPGGGRGALDVTLTRPGTYTLVCTLPGHEQLGMRARLTVTRRP